MGDGWFTQYANNIVYGNSIVYENTFSAARVGAEKVKQDISVEESMGNTAVQLTLSERVSLYSTNLDTQRAEKWQRYYDLMEKYYSMEPVISNMGDIVENHSKDFSFSPLTNSLIFIKTKFGVFDKLFKNNSSNAKRAWTIVSCGTGGKITIGSWAVQLACIGFQFHHIIAVLFLSLLLGLHIPIAYHFSKKKIADAYIPVENLSVAFPEGIPDNVLSDLDRTLANMEAKINNALLTK